MNNNQVMKVMHGHFDMAADEFGKDNVWATMLYGSQNYGMATETSDVDTKTMLFPTVKATVLGGKTVATDLTYTDGSLVGVRDYRDTFALFMRGNVRFLETLYSGYTVVNKDYRSFFFQLTDNRELVANARPRKLMHSAAGMAKQKYEALEHSYPSKVDVLKKYGYDPKQLHHLVRLLHFMEDYTGTLSYGACLRPADCLHDYLLGLKVDPLPLEKARHLATKSMEWIERFMKDVDSGLLPEDNHSKDAQEFLDALTLDVFKFRYKIAMEEQ